MRLQSDPALCLNCYSTSHDDVDSDSVGVAEQFAVRAAIAMGHLRAKEQFRTAIGTRTTIGTAVGIVMERYQLTQAEAFAYLVRQSSSQNRKMRLIAAEVLQDAEDDIRITREGTARRPGAHEVPGSGKSLSK